MTYDRTTLDAVALRALARTTAARVFPAAPPRPWWRAIFSDPAPRQRRFKHLCARFTSGELVKEPFFKVEEGTALRLREDGVIEHGRYTLQQSHIESYTEVREATDDELLLADHRWTTEWSDGRERVLNASRGTLTVTQKGAGLRQILEGLR